MEPVTLPVILDFSTSEPRKEAESSLGFITTDWKNIVMGAAVAAQAAVLFFAVSTTAIQVTVTSGLLLGAYYVGRARELQSIQAAVRDLTFAIARFDHKSSDHFEKLSQTEDGLTDLIAELKKASDAFFTVFQSQSAVGLWQETIAALKEYQMAKTELAVIRSQISQDNETLALITARLEKAVSTLSQNVEKDAQLREELEQLLRELKA